jgi:phenylpropionate dioxygenase-like ring-hydroxylating dioxygenase large terminal subunit
MDSDRAKRMQAFSGYHHPKDRPVDDELSRVGPGTPCGEYMRRYWHPILLSSELKDLPRAIRILGEDLVVYRDLSGGVGLVHKHCPHRGMSLEYGMPAQKGIRCAYHGWLIGNDGRVLETPGEPVTSRMKDGICTGAYKVIEFQGLIFAYFGPPELEPEFPHFDVYDMANNAMKPYQIMSACNWLQVSENSVDPFHTPFLHTRISGPHFADVFAELPVIDYHRRDFGLFYTNARRIGPFIWCRVHDHLFPNFSQNGSTYEKAKAVRYFGRPSLTRWVTPIDDTHSYVIAFRHFNDRDDPLHEGSMDQTGWEKTDFYGQGPHLPLEMRQRKPGDYDAWMSQGPINSHARENLGTTDQGVTMLRRWHRDNIRALAGGTQPPAWKKSGDRHVATFAGDTVLRIPPSNVDDRKLVLDTSKRIAEAYLAHQHLPDEERRTRITAQLAPLNV